MAASTATGARGVVPAAVGLAQVGRALVGGGHVGVRHACAVALDDRRHVGPGRRLGELRQVDEHARTGDVVDAHRQQRRARALQDRPHAHTAADHTRQRTVCRSTTVSRSGQ